MSWADLTLASIQYATASGFDDTWFEVTCPVCGKLTLVSRYEPDGHLNDCDACETGQFWFYAGEFEHARKYEHGA